MLVLGLLVNFAQMKYFLVKTKSKHGKTCPMQSGSCFEDNIAYMGNNIVIGADNPQPSRSACQKSCKENPDCKFWTWVKTDDRCYLKDACDVDNLTHDDTYVFGSKDCSLPEDKEGGNGGGEEVDYLGGGGGGTNGGNGGAGCICKCSDYGISFPGVKGPIKIGTVIDNSHGNCEACTCNY